MRAHIAIVRLTPGFAGWEVSHAGRVLYWGTGVRRALAEAECAAEMLAPAVVVIDGEQSLGGSGGDLPDWGYG